MKIGKAFVSVAVAATLLSCGGANYLTPMSSKTADEAVYEEILKLVDQKDYEGALASYGSLSESFRGRVDVVKTLAGIHAGRCGLDFLPFSGGLGGSGALFSLFMSGFTELVVDPEACQEAQNVIEDSFGDTAVDRVSALGTEAGTDINTFMAILGGVKIGAQLRAVADTDGAATGTGDGTVDGGFDACQAGSIADDEVVQVGTGLALLLTNFSTIASSFGDGNSQAIEDLSNTCALLVPNPCDVTDPDHATWADPVALTAIRGLVKSQSMGIQDCVNANAFTCCP